ncbi:hypothetical protein [Companilactobacillus furfuricola]|uniref:hypothetical protein n=1 Tax=Companilactobacillus furfuricola TaxID=1462575 RepID=UPI000F777FC0|nr:hypothetical protein [Companilactobacillus furfuricola]
MRRRKLFFGLSGLLIVVVAFSAYFAFQSYSNTDIDHEAKVTTSETGSAKATTKSHKKKTTDKPFYLQNTDNPDRFLAINPKETKGIFRYRAQANGDIYPEYEYFNGQTSKNSDNLTVTPKNTSNQSASFSFVKQKNGQYKDEKTGENYKPVDVEENGSNNKSSKKVDPDWYRKYLKNSLSSYSNPSKDNYSKRPYNKDTHQPIYLKNGDYYDINENFFYGDKPMNVTFKQVYDDYKNYLYYFEESPSYNRVMYYKNNDIEVVSDDEIKENIEWNKAHNKSFGPVNDINDASFVKPYFRDSNNNKVYVQ